MLIDFLTQHLFVALGAWIAIYVFDFSLTMLAAQLYRDGAEKHITVQGGIELTPTFRKDVAAVRWLSPRFLLALTLSSLLIVFFFVLSSRIPNDHSFAFFIGALLLAEVAVQARNIVTYVQYRQAAQSVGITGHIEYARWYGLHLSAIHQSLFAFFYLLLYLDRHQPFFLGGFWACAVVAFQHERWSRRERRLTP